MTTGEIGKRLGRDPSMISRLYRDYEAKRGACSYKQANPPGKTRFKSFKTFNRFAPFKSFQYCGLFQTFQWFQSTNMLRSPLENATDHCKDLWLDI
jgi:hypothetical protein